ncbi:hypothetical protein LPB79_13005 [Rhizobium sp. T136]|uniref:hypothetical protein n=1 Tax=Rhizobium sp. T136 TaxID=555319 RepID=UPI001E5DDEC7|nr:hypothetical protein [Rhizobium sp. T136]UFS83165.1 hypothetical protein LPB79_13005 [Rhizobium sp. T136]
MTRLDRLIRRAVASWQSWQTRRRLYRALPGLRVLDEAEREARERHRRVSDIRKLRTDVMTAALRGEAR